MLHTYAGVSSSGGFPLLFLTSFACLGQGMLVQGFDLKKNVYNNRFQPYVAYWGAFWNAVFILVNGFEVFFKWQTTNFLTSCEYQELFVHILLKFRQISVFPSSSHFMHSGKYTSVHRFGKRRTWILPRYAYDMFVMVASNLVIGNPDNRRNWNACGASKEYLGEDRGASLLVHFLCQFFIEFHCV